MLLCSLGMLTEPTVVSYYERWSLHLSFVSIVGEVLKNICGCILECSLLDRVALQSLPALRLGLGWKKGFGALLLLSRRKHPAFVTDPLLPEFPRAFPASPSSKTLPKSLTCGGAKM